MQIIAPVGFVAGSSVGSLFGPHMSTMELGIGKVVRESFATHPVRHLTGSAILERIDFCISKAAELYRVLEWSSDRILDALPAALRARLDGVPWEPSARASWAPADQQ